LVLFVGGDRSQVVFFKETIFAKLGYVVVAPDYRVGIFGPNQVSTTLAVLRGAHDMKACVRYLKKTVVEDDNPYGIDPDRIIVGGVSAGGISAIHAAYLDTDTEIPAYMTADTAGLGGVEGNSGTPSYSSAPLAVLSLVEPLEIVLGLTQAMFLFAVFMKKMTELFLTSQQRLRFLVFLQD